MIEEISDTRLQRLYKQKIAQNPKDIELLKSQLYCGARIITQTGIEPGVFVLRNNNTARFFGATHCDNPWACPVCAAKKMSKHAIKIATAIDALKAQNQTAIMITLTIPHTSGMSCEETLDILRNTWAAFIIRGNKNLQSSWYKRTNGKVDHSKRMYGASKCRDPFASFSEHFNCIHRVRVGEFTWGKHGWHPHYHCLFWVDSDKLQEVAEWEKKLRDRWLQLAKRYTLRQWNLLYPNKISDNKTRLEIMYQNLDEKSTALFISKTESGEIIAQKSSQYICGWGADKEVTGNVKNKASNPDHYSPYQILVNAYESQGEKREFWLNLYMQYARTLAKRKCYRVRFSKDLKKIVDEWKTTEQHLEVLKKKFMENEKANGRWTMACWFSVSSWKKICFLDTKTPIKEVILQLAMQTDAKTLIDEFLEQYDIRSEDKIHNHAQFFENEIFNRAYYA